MAALLHGEMRSALAAWGGTSSTEHFRDEVLAISRRWCCAQTTCWAGSRTRCAGRAGCRPCGSASARAPRWPSAHSSPRCSSTPRSTCRTCSKEKSLLG
ncbi:Protein of unknown function, partial [Gryllus bimaculatus]